MAEHAGLLDPLAQGTRASELTADAAFLAAMVRAETALTLSLVDAGLVPDWMEQVAADLSDATLLDLPAIAAAGRAGGNPVIPLVSALRSRAESIRDGASDHVHVGATSQDILDTAAMIVAGGVVEEVLSQLGSLADALAQLADRHRDTVMVGRTLGQHASPTTFGFVVAGWLDAVSRARGGLLAVSLPLQLGGAVGTLAVLTSIAAAGRPDTAASGHAASGTAASDIVDLVVARMAERLGLARPAISWHTDRVVVTALASALATATGVVGAFALDVTVLSRTEIAEVLERPSPGAGGSSAMPHKRNPATAVLIASAARQAPGLLATCHSSLAAEDQRPSGAWHAEWMALRALESIAISSAAGAAELAHRLDVDRDRMLENLGMSRGLVFSERVTTVLAERLGRAAAFALVARASDDAVRTGSGLRAAIEEQLAGDPATPDAAPLADRIARCFDPGDRADLSSARAAVDRVLAEHRAAPSGRADSDRDGSTHDGVPPHEDAQETGGAP